MFLENLKKKLNLHEREQKTGIENNYSVHTHRNNNINHSNNNAITMMVTCDHFSHFQKSQAEMFSLVGIDIPSLYNEEKLYS